MPQRLFTDTKIAFEAPGGKDMPEERWVMARISTTAVDRDGDVMMPQGVDLTDFHKNPVVLFIHDGGKLPIGKAVGIRRRSDDVVAKVIFAKRPPELPAEVEWVPDTVHHMFKEGVLRAFSVGFEIPPGGARPADKRDAVKFGDTVRRVITRWKLVEFSVVPIPANQDALVLAVSKGYLPQTSFVRQEMVGMDDTIDMIGDGHAPMLEVPSREDGDDLPPLEF